MKIKIYNKVFDLKDDCPTEVMEELKKRNKTISSDLFFKYYDYWPSSHKLIIGPCAVCGTECKNQIPKIRYRTYAPGKLLCRKCSAKEPGKHPEFLKRNSDAQHIAQNRPEVKKKMSESLIRTWSDEETAKRWAAGIARNNSSKEGREATSRASKRLWQDEKYRSKMLDSFIGFRGVSGYFLTKNSGKIRFDSTYEFFYLFFEDLKGNKIKRFGGEIKYVLNGMTKGYRPDFIDQNNNLIEIKSSYVRDVYNGLEELNAKRDAAKKFIEENDYNDYYLLEERDLNLYAKLRLRYQLMFLMRRDGHISIHHGKVSDFKESSVSLKKAEEFYKEWNSLK
jgi:hypothetical protein